MTPTPLIFFLERLKTPPPPGYIYVENSVCEYPMNYPGLFYCFEYLFSIMASSVPSESLFSEAGDQVKDKRNRLDPEKVNKMMVLEGFYKFK